MIDFLLYLERDTRLKQNVAKYSFLNLVPVNALEVRNKLKGPRVHGGTHDLFKFVLWSQATF